MARERNRRLTPKQKRFADLYIETGNATQSYIKAGYKCSNYHVAEANARKLLVIHGVKSYIQDLINEKDSAQIAKADEVLKFLTSVVRGEITEELVDFWDGEEQRADKAPSIKDRVKAAELLGKRYLLFTDKQVHEHSHSIVFVDDLDELDTPDELDDMEEI